MRSVGVFSLDQNIFVFFFLSLVTKPENIMVVFIELCYYSRHTLERTIMELPKYFLGTLYLALC